MKYVMDYKSKMTNNASIKPRRDIVKTLKENGWEFICIYNLEKKIILRHLEMLLAFIKLMRLKKNDILLLQWPFSFLKPLKKVNIEKHLRCKKIIFIHDVNSLRKQDKVYPEIARFNQCDLIVTHTEPFKSWLIEKGVKKPIIIHELFDYRLTEKIEHVFAKKTKYQIVFAGNLAKTKAGFLYSHFLAQNFTLELYGGNYTGEANSTVHYRGSFPPDELVYNLKGEFGLVWDGQSQTTCSGECGEYLRYNCPYKCAMYIAAQLPIIIWSQAAMASFVKEKEIGILVDSINEIDEKLANLELEEYKKFIENISKIQDRVIKGQYILDSTKLALEYLK